MQPALHIRQPRVSCRLSPDLDPRRRVVWEKSCGNLTERGALVRARVPALLDGVLPMSFAASRYRGTYALLSPDRDYHSNRRPAMVIHDGPLVCVELLVPVSRFFVIVMISVISK